jgi:small-conductance mechanosensitive channel
VRGRRYGCAIVGAALCAVPLLVAVAAGGAADTDVGASARAALGSVWSELLHAGTYPLFEVSGEPVTFLRLLRVALIVVAAWWMSRALQHALARITAGREGINQASVYALGRITHYLVLIGGFVIGLVSINIHLTELALLLSAVGVGLGFGLQAIFSNFISGIIVLFERSLKVGDFVELESGVQGEVKEINIRSTLITTNDNIDILVPNSEFVTGRVTNWTLRDVHRRVRVPFGVAYGSDKELARKAGLEAAREVPFTMWEPERQAPQVWLVGFGDSSLNFELVVWLADVNAVKRPSAVHAAYTWALETALARHGLEIPFPQRDLHLRSVFGRRDDDAKAWLDRDVLGRSET